MAEIICPKCGNRKRANQIKIFGEADISIEGIITCLKCKHEFQFTMYGDTIQKIDVALPGEQSGNLNTFVPADIVDDVQEAERANYARCYKACAAMCRRALQLSLMEKGIKDAPLSKMLEDASKNLLTPDTFQLAKSIKGYGDIGVHRKDVLEPQEVNMLIYATVRMLNEVCKESSTNANESN